MQFFAAIPGAKWASQKHPNAALEAIPRHCGGAKKKGNPRPTRRAHYPLCHLPPSLSKAARERLALAAALERYRWRRRDGGRRGKPRRTHGISVQTEGEGRVAKFVLSAELEEREQRPKRGDFDASSSDSGEEAGEKKALTDAVVERFLRRSAAPTPKQRRVCRRVVEGVRGHIVPEVVTLAD